MCIFLCIAPIFQKRTNSFGMNGGDDETRTRDLCRDRRGYQVLSTTYKAVGDCQVLDNTHKSATSRVEHRVEKRARIYSHTLRMSRLGRKLVTSEDAIRHECI
jgi:hypothetical protein